MVYYLVVVFHTRWSLRISNAIGFVKLATLIFISITGLVVLGGHTKVKNPTANFHNAFAGTSDATAYGATNAMVKIIFSYTGYANAFNVVNEVKVRYAISIPPLFYPTSMINH
jgi:amino acid transporter